MNILAVIAFVLQLTLSSPSAVVISFPQADPAKDNLRVAGGVECRWLTYHSIVCYPPAGAESLTLDVQMDCSVKTAFLTVWEYKSGADPVQSIVYVDNTDNCAQAQMHHRQYLPMVNR